MKSDIFTNLEANYDAYQLGVVEKDGVTWFRALKEEAKPVRYNALAVVDNLVIDFFELGRMIADSANEAEYKPLYFEDGIITRYNDENKSVRIDYTYLQDKNSPLLKKNKEQIVVRVLEFLNRYGSLGYKSTELSDLAVEEAITREFGVERYFSTSPLSWVVYKIYELYIKYKKPDTYIELLKKTPRIHIFSTNEKDMLRTRISLSVSYTSKGWIEKKHVWSLLDLITLFLFYSDNKFIRECPCCFNYFVTTNEKAVYCSPVCRNRFNTKKSYYKKRTMQNADDSETR